MTPIRSLYLLTACLLGSILPASAAAEHPNILLIIADDCTYRDLGTYGGQAHTPHLDRLASEGMLFERCFQAAPMCSPTRHCLYTGIYPVKSGAYPNHTMAHKWVKSIAHYLQSAGYSTHLSGKRHIQPASVFPFEYSGKNNPDPAVFATLLQQSTAKKQPFLFIAASNEPHSPWNQGDPSAYPPAELQLPPVLVDSPDTRDGFSRYLAEVTYFDSQVGELLTLLDDHPDLAKNTLIIVLSEQGNSFPFAKWTCYDAGLQSGCIIRWPGKVQPGSRSSAMVEYVDIVPTMLEAAGLPRPDILDGRSFLPVLTGKASSHKTHVFGLQTTRGIINGSDFYGIRSVRNERYRLIHNLSPEATFQNAATKDSTFLTWIAMAEAGDPTAKRLVHDYQHRPEWELYDTEKDPWNRNNLINEPELSSIRQELQNQLQTWMTQQGDEGQATELKALERMPKADQRAAKAEAKGKGKGKGKGKAKS